MYKKMNVSNISLCNNRDQRINDRADSLKIEMGDERVGEKKMREIKMKRGN